MRAHAVVFASLASLSLAVYAGCDGGGDAPEPVSVFATEGPYARQILGRVLRGTEVVVGANVRIVPVGDLAASAGLDAASNPGQQTSSDLGGKYYIPNGPAFYDLSIRKDREVVVFRSLTNRYFEPSFGVAVPLRGFAARVAPSTSPPVAPGNAVAYFVSGVEARAVSAEGSSLVATFRNFTSRVSLHAVEYVASEGLVAARRWGVADVPLTDGGGASAVVATNAIPLAAAAGGAGDTNQLTIDAVPPPGFTVSSIDLVMDLGLRTSAQTIARPANGAPFRLDIVRSARYFVRAVARRGEAISDSGLQFINPFVARTTVLLPRVVKESAFDASAGFTAVADDTICEITPTFGTDNPACRSVVEHVLVPASPAGTSLRVLTTDRATALPDVTSLGVPAPRGKYAWTVLQYPTVQRVDGLSGEDARAVASFSTTAPRFIDLP